MFKYFSFGLDQALLLKKIVFKLKIIVIRQNSKMGCFKFPSLKIIEMSKV